jgi:hypothetical protein
MTRPILPAHRLLLAGLLVLLILWGLGFIYRSSFVVGGERTFCLFDDSMISMTYARNLVEDHGLEWGRQGAPVEGFTHPLWLLAMIPVNALPIELRWKSLFIQLLSLALLAGCAVAAERLVRRHFSAGSGSGLAAAVLVAFYYPLAYWSLMGMETALAALLVLLAVQLALDVVHEGAPHHLRLWIVCTLLGLLRMDLLLAVLVVQAYVVLAGGLRSAARRGRRDWWMGLAILVASQGGYELFRWLYFQDLLPNTYYLKLTGVALSVRLLRGGYYFARFLEANLWVFLATAVGVGVLVRRNRRMALPALLFLAYCAYDVYVGGDSWDGSFNIQANRFLAFVMPLFFVLVNALLNELQAAWPARGGEEAGGLPVSRLIAGLLAGACLLTVDSLWFSETSKESWDELTLTERPPVVERHRGTLEKLRSFRILVDPRATVATAWAGIPAYFSDYKMLDILGYNDRVGARLPPAEPIDEDTFLRFIPGHVKWSEKRLLTEQRPDAFFQIWGVKELGPVWQVMQGAGYRRVGGFWVRTDSPYLHIPKDLPEAPQAPAQSRDESPGVASRGAELPPPRHKHHAAERHTLS